MHLVTHDNIFAKGPDVLHDNRHLRKRHIGLFANLVEVIHGRTRPAQLLTTQTRSRRSQQSETVPLTVPLGTYASYSSAVKSFPTEVSCQERAPYIPQCQQ